MWGVRGRKGKNSHEQGILEKTDPHTLILEIGMSQEMDIISSVVTDIECAVIKLVDGHNFPLVMELQEVKDQIYDNGHYIKPTTNKKHFIIQGCIDHFYVNGNNFSTQLHG